MMRKVSLSFHHQFWWKHIHFYGISCRSLPWDCFKFQIISKRNSKENEEEFRLWRWCSRELLSYLLKEACFMPWKMECLILSFTLDGIPYAPVMFLYALRKKHHTTFLLLKTHATPIPAHFKQNTPKKCQEKNFPRERKKENNFPREEKSIFLP